MKRANYLQIPNNQLLKKIRLAFDYVRTPLKSELDFNKSLIANDLTKHNSLQTFVFWRPGKQHLCQGNAGEDGLAGKVDFSGKFSTPRPAFFSGAADNQRLAKTGMDLGALGSTQKQGSFHNLLIIKVSAKEALAMGWKTCPAPVTGTGTKREKWKDAAP